MNVIYLAEDLALMIDIDVIYYYCLSVCIYLSVYLSLCFITFCLLGFPPMFSLHLEFSA